MGLASCGAMSSLLWNSLWLIAVDPHRSGSISLRPCVYQPDVGEPSCTEPFEGAIFASSSYAWRNSWRCFPLTQRQNEPSPRLLIEPASCRAGAAQGQWLTAWRVHNLGWEPVVMLSPWLPHDKFATSPQGIAPPVRLAPG